MPSKFVNESINTISSSDIYYNGGPFGFLANDSNNHLLSIVYLHFQLDYGTWKSTLTIESVLNSDYTTYQCIASNALGEDGHNISLTSPNIPDPPLNIEVTMKDYKTVRLKVLI